MKEAVIDLFVDARRGDGVSIFVLVTLTAASIVVLILAFVLVDSSFIDTREEPAMVLDKWHDPGHFRPQVVSTGTTTVVSQVWVPDSWVVAVQASGEELPCKVGKGQFDRVAVNDRVLASIGRGRLSGSTYCKGINLGGRDE